MGILEMTVSVFALALSVYAALISGKSNSAVVEDSLNSKLTAAKESIQKRLEEIRMEKSEKKRKYFIETLDFYLENLLNIYDAACGMYLDAKIDRKRFRMDYSQGIKESVEGKFTRKILEKHSDSYSSLLRVYRKWFSTP